ncbi:hypothetical protein LguiA_019668 [Lonicera macranthoides]
MHNEKFCTLNTIFSATSFEPIKQCQLFGTKTTPILILKLLEPINLLFFNLYHFHLWFLDPVFGNSDSEHSVLHPRLNFLHICIFWQPKPPAKIPPAPFCTVPLIVFLFFNFPLSTDFQHSSFL